VTGRRENTGNTGFWTKGAAPPLSLSNAGRSRSEFHRAVFHPALAGVETDLPEMFVALLTFTVSVRNPRRNFHMEPPFGPRMLQGSGRLNLT
jgi:hypothetical protein